MTRCSEYFKEAMRLDGDPFTVGFMAGQAEKVKLGACEAFMVPKKACSQKLAQDLANVYDLALHVYNKWQREYWFTKNDQVLDFKYCEVHSPKWNMLRAAMCGIPADQINLEFHKDHV